MTKVGRGMGSSLTGVRVITDKVSVGKSSLCDASSAKKERKVICETYNEFISRAEPKSAKYCLSEYVSENNNFYILKTL